MSGEEMEGTAPETDSERIAREIAEYGDQLGEPVHPWVRQEVEKRVRKAVGDARAETIEEAAKVAGDLVECWRGLHVSGAKADGMRQAIRALGKGGRGEGG